MKAKRKSGVLFFMNSPILTNYGIFSHREISKDEVVEMIKGDYISVIGHVATANFLSALLNTTIPYNRKAIKMRAGDKAIIFRLSSRCREGQHFTEHALREEDYSFSLLSLIEEQS